MDVYLLRHGKAQDHSAGIAGDAGRRLTESGRIEITRIASGIISLGIKPDVLVSSPLTRAKETADLVLSALHAASDMGKTRSAIWPDLAPEGSMRDTHRRLIRMPPDSAVMLVGHEPHMSSLASSMILDAGRTCDAACGVQVMMNLKKGGLVAIRGSARGQYIRGSLRSLMAPRQLKLCGRPGR